MYFSFEPVLSDNIDQLLVWFKEEHVAKWWADAPQTIEEVQQKYIKKIDRQHVFPFVAYCNGIAIGFYQYYLIEPKPSVGIDFFIGNRDYLGKGYGAQLILEFIKFIYSCNGIIQVYADTPIENEGAKRCLLKAGFSQTNMTNFTFVFDCRVNVGLASITMKPIITALLQEYLLELSQFQSIDKNPDGHFNYQYLDYYWNEATRYPYLFTLDDEIFGFALVRKVDDIFLMAEFFVLKKFRGKSNALFAVFQIFQKHLGPWVIEYTANNQLAKKFWTAATRYYHDRTTNILKDGEWEVLHFNTSLLLNLNQRMKVTDE